MIMMTMMMNMIMMMMVMLYFRLDKMTSLPSPAKISQLFLDSCFVCSYFNTLATVDSTRRTRSRSSSVVLNDRSEPVVYASSKTQRRRGGAPKRAAASCSVSARRARVHLHLPDIFLPHFSLFLSFFFTSS